MSQLKTCNWHETAVRWLKFNFVGGVGVLVQLAALTALTSGMGLDYLYATVLAVETAVIHNFVWHERFTWAERCGGEWPAVMARLLRFNLSTGLVSIIGNLLLMRLLVGHMHLHYLPANIVAIGSCALANFLVSDHLVFRKLQSEKVRD
jgi:putative flippase GtrA